MNTRPLFLGFGAAVTLLIISWGFNTCQSVSLPADVAAASAQLPQKIDYNLHVKPILSDRCFACHGPDQNKQKAGLRLDIAEVAYDKKCENGLKAIVPGNAAQSDLVKRILSADLDYVMPEPQSHLTLSAEEKAVLVKWVEQGAEYKPHWSLIIPKKIELPEVKNGAWVKNEIDRFVLKKIEEKGFLASSTADKTTLLRRVSMDLTGLPPTPVEIANFLSDSSFTAYEKVVNRLLKSPHYGEHQAVNWLDLARYADTQGYQLDVMRTAWPYRDWVISAFNRNLSFGRFVTWQLAGDLLPHPQRGHLIATAFNRMHPQNQEGGIVAEEYLAEYAADRVNTFGKAFLGLTVECARCHDHKYDPISQKDYYQLFAFFNNVNEAGQVPFYGESSPTVLLTTPETDQKLKAIRAKIEQLLVPISNRDGSGLRPHGQPRPTQEAQKWRIAARQNPHLIPQKRGLIGSYSFDEPNRKQFKNAANPKKPAVVSGDEDKLPEIVKGKFGNGRVVNGDGNISLGGNFAYFERNEPFSVSLWVNFQKTGLRGPIFARTNGLDNGERGYECVLNKDGTLGFHLTHNYPDNAIDFQTLQKVPLKQWLHLTLTYDGSGTAQGTHVYWNGQRAAGRIHADNLKKSMLYGKGRSNGFGLMLPFMIGAKFRDSMAGFWVDELEIYDRALTPIEVQETMTKQPIVKQWIVQNKPLTSAQQAQINEFYEANVSPNTLKINAELKKLRRQETTLYDASDELMVMKERPFAQPTHVLRRGVYDAPAERVLANTPAQLLSFKDYPKNRLGLAQWLLNKKNPLFARVVVNRMWQQFFGRGLVASSDDFGNQGNLPSHPELLDWLAVDFQQSWNVKALQKQIVMSATYRQASAQNLKMAETDPENIWLTRGASYRLSAEQIRDNALAASGLLNRKIGGLSVYPYQPAGVWEALAASTGSPPYPQTHGDSLYRRSLYTIWKRTAPSPSMIIFDTPERHTCTVKRQKTSTPLQALVTLNDPQFVEAARVLAMRAMRLEVKGERLEGGSAMRRSEKIESNINHKSQITKSQITNIFTALLSRAPRSQELALMIKLYEEELKHFQQNPAQAVELLRVGEYPVDKHLNKNELAAMTVVCSTVMNLDEAVVKR